MKLQPELQRLTQVIDSEAALLRGFVSLLEREESLLIDGDADGLLVLSKEKSERYHQLQRLHEDRGLLLARLGKPNTAAAVRDVCAPLPDTLKRWDEVLRLAADAQQRNGVNGKLITERMQNNQAALAVLLDAARRPQFYDAAGMTHTFGGGRHLGSA